MRNALKSSRYALLALAIVAGVSCSRDPNVVKVKYLENGNRYFDKGQYKEAYIMYRNALKKDMKYSEAYFRVAQTELRMGRPLDAARDFRRAIDTNPKQEEARIQLGELYLLSYLSHRSGEQSLAPMIKALSDELLKLNPKSAPGLRLRGYLEMTSNQLPAALATFRQANDIAPLHPEIVHPLVQVLFASGQSAEAEKLARQLIEKQKTFGPIYDLLYQQAMRDKRLSDAENILKLKIANNPANGDYMLQLARHYQVLDRKEEMRAVLEKVGSKNYVGGRMKAGIFYRGIRDFDSALREYQEGEKEDPKHKASYEKTIAEVLVAERRLPEAVKVLDAVLKDNPADDQAKAMRAALLIETGNPKEVQIAVEELQSVVTRMPANPVLRFNLGRAQMVLGHIEQARTQFQEAVKLQKDYVAPRLALAQLSFYYRHDWGQALQYSDEVLEIDPHNLPARLMRSSALAAVGNHDQARKELAETIKEHPNSREAHVQIGLLDLDEKRYSEAESEYRQLYQQNPDELRAVQGLAETYAKEGQAGKAIDLLQKELAKHPERVEIRMLLGNLAFRNKDYDVAIQDYRELLKARPNAGDVYVLLGETYRLKGDVNSARQAFDKAVALRPNDPIPHLRLALLLDQLGERAVARPIYEQVLKIEPDNAVALNNVAYMMAEGGEDLDLALNDARRAKQKLPDNPDVADTLGWILIKKNLSDEAIRVYNDLVAKQPNRSTFRYHLGMALYQKGDRVQAKKELQTALQNHPSKDEEAKIRDLMGKLG
jgi:tetratricopeptide (TPR) repeat protein